MNQITVCTRMKLIMIVKKYKHRHNMAYSNKQRQFRVRLIGLCVLSMVLSINCLANGYVFADNNNHSYYSSNVVVNRMSDNGTYVPAYNQPPQDDLFFRPYVVPIEIYNQSLGISRACTATILGNQIDSAGRPVPFRFWLLTSFDCIFQMVGTNGYNDLQMLMTIPVQSNQPIAVNPSFLGLHRQKSSERTPKYQIPFFMRDSLTDSFRPSSSLIISKIIGNFLNIHLALLAVDIPFLRTVSDNPNTTTYRLATAPVAPNNAMLVGFGHLPKADDHFLFDEGIYANIINYQHELIRLNVLNYSYFLTLGMNTLLFQSLQALNVIPNRTSFLNRSFACNGDLGASVFDFDMHNAPVLIGLLNNSSAVITRGMCDVMANQMVRSTFFNANDIAFILNTTNLQNHP